MENRRKSVTDSGYAYVTQWFWFRKFERQPLKKINLMALIRTLTISTATFERMKKKFYGFRQTEQVHNIVSMLTTSATWSQHFTRTETPSCQEHSNPTTITTRSQQTYDWYQTKELQCSQQGKDSCNNLTRTGQQVHKIKTGLRSLSPCITSVQYCGGCSVLWGIPSVLRGIPSVLRKLFSTVGGKHPHCGWIASVLWMDSISTVDG